MNIGLTGSIASGKSTVSKMLKQKGFPIVDADEIARLVVEPGTLVIEEISSVFGHEVISEDGSLNRERLGSIIFSKQSEREKLNAIIHPAIREEMLKQREQWYSVGEKVVIMDIPLLFESKLEHLVDKIIVVSVTPEIQKERLIARNKLSVSEAINRIESQLPVKLKEKNADAVIYNNGSIEETRTQLEKILIDWKINF